MLDERIAQLIQEDVDGELAAPDRAELSQALLSSPEARQFHDEMKRVAGLMDELPVLDPPESLHSRIVKAIEISPSAPFINQPAKWLRPMSYGLAVAAGVVMTLGFVHVAPRESQDFSSLVGTMVSQDQPLSQSFVSALGIEHSEVTGRIELKSLPQASAIEIDMNSPDAVELTLNFGVAGLQFGGIANQSGNSPFDEFEVSGGKVQLMNQGKNQFVVFLRTVPGNMKTMQKIEISIRQNGEFVYQGLLESGG